MEVIRPSKSQDGPLPFSPAVGVGPFVLVSGQASVDSNGAIVPDDFAGEMRRSFANVVAVLDAAKLGLGDVVQVRSYVGQQADLAEYNRIYAELFSPPVPGANHAYRVPRHAPEV